MSAPFILVVDDSPEVREAMVELLEGEGYEVHSARDGHEALALLEAQARPALALVDWRMPRMDGGTFLRVLAGTAHAAHTHVVITSASPEPFIALPGATVLRKPFELDALLTLVERTCGPQRRRTAADP